MADITERVEIARSASDVFEYVADYENDPAWRSGVTELRWTSPAPIQVGRTTREVMRVLGRNVITEGRVSAHDPGRRTDFASVSGPFPVTGYRLVEGNGDKTTLTFHLTAQLPRPYRPIASLIAFRFRRRTRRDLQRLKQVLEQE